MQIQELKAQCEELTESWVKVHDETFVLPEGSPICPTCKRAFQAEDIEDKKIQMEENFNDTKNKRLLSLSNLEEAKREKIKKLSLEIEDKKRDLELFNNVGEALISKRKELLDKIHNFTPVLDLDKNREYQALRNEGEELENKLNAPVEENQETIKLEKQKLELTAKLDECKKRISLVEQNEKFKARIQELLQEERFLSEQVAELEKQEFLCEDYVKTKVELLESSINSKFKYVTFKLFNTLVNGAVEECCEALIKGVPFSGANTASQINGGLDIINTLCLHYNVQAPIFIDNRESVNEILKCDSQIINLVVSNDRALVVEG